MLHLAQVQIKKTEGRSELVLLARQHSEYTWKVLGQPTVMPFANVENYGDQSLVLVNLSDLGEIVSLESAKNWVLHLIQMFLREGITPDFLQGQREWIEQGRQELTSGYQDLDRRALELEARREQIEQLEENLKREKKQIEVLADQYKKQSQNLDLRLVELDARQEPAERPDQPNSYEQQSNSTPSV